MRLNSVKTVGFYEYKHVTFYHADNIIIAIVHRRRVFIFVRFSYLNKNEAQIQGGDSRGSLLPSLLLKFLSLRN